MRSPQWLTLPLGVAGDNHVARWPRFLFYQWNLFYCSGLWIWFFPLLISDRLLALTITCYQFCTTNETIPPPCYSMLYALSFTCLDLYFIPHYLQAIKTKTQESRHAQNFTSSIWSIIVIFILPLTTRLLWPNYLKTEWSIFSETLIRIWWPHVFLLKGPPLIVDMHDPLNTCPICDKKNPASHILSAANVVEDKFTETVLLSVMKNSRLSKILIIGIVDCVIWKYLPFQSDRDILRIWGDIE